MSDITTLGELLEDLRILVRHGVPKDAPVRIEGYKPGTEDHNRGYNVVDVAGSVDDQGGFGVTIYGMLRE